MPNDILVSVIVCTHNPREDYLRATLDALRNQTLSPDQWELLLIDNASNISLARKFEVGWHPNARILREEELGLTAARLRGIRDSGGDLLVFVDDDNVTANNYLEKASFLKKANPHIGAFGASITGQFEVTPPERIKPYLTGLVVEELDRDYWSNLTVWSRAVPFGAGMCVLRKVAEAYAGKLACDPRRKGLGRSGRTLGAGEDTDMAWCATELGLGTARFCDLKLKHLIPKERLTENYIVNLNAGFAASELALRLIWGEDPKPSYSATAEWRSFLRQSIRASSIRRRILLLSMATRRKVFAEFS